jgi:serpin B
VKYGAYDNHQEGEYPMHTTESRKIIVRLKAVVIVLASLLLVFGVTACNAPAPSSVSSNKPRLALAAPQTDVAELTAGNNVFAFDLYQKIKDGQGNMLFSPYSISQALAMVYAGARETTAQQMADALYFTLGQDRLNPAFNSLALDLEKRSSLPISSESEEVGFQLNVANAIWGQKGYAFLPEYLDLLAQNYGAGLQVADFAKAPDAAVREINRWVSQATNERIPQILEALDPDTRLVLANAVYFNALWEKQFDEKATKTEPFYLLDGQAKDAPLMRQTEHFMYTEGEAYQAVELPYANPDFAMLIVLPKEGQFQAIEAGLTSEMVQEITQGFQDKEVILTMPRFRFETPALSLGDALAGMGMPEAFSDNANFSGISLEKPGLKIDDIVHKAFIEVNEKKTEAAGVTVAIMEAASLQPTAPPPVEMRIDRPFIFLIRDTQTNTILFVGRLLEPTE